MAPKWWYSEMTAGHTFWHAVTVLFGLGVIGSLLTVVLFAGELLRVAMSKDETSENYTPGDSTTS